MVHLSLETDRQTDRQTDRGLAMNTAVGRTRKHLKTSCEFHRLLSVTPAQSYNCSDFGMIKQWDVEYPCVSLNGAVDTVSKPTICVRSTVMYVHFCNYPSNHRYFGKVSRKRKKKVGFILARMKIPHFLAKGAKNKIHHILSCNSGVMQQFEHNCQLSLGPLITVRGPISCTHLTHMSP
jgi:hypothetical protein